MARRFPSGNTLDGAIRGLDTVAPAAQDATAGRSVTRACSLKVPSAREPSGVPGDGVGRATEPNMQVYCKPLSRGGSVVLNIKTAWLRASRCGILGVVASARVVSGAAAQDDIGSAKCQQLALPNAQLLPVRASSP